ncbi:hypothetical protein B2G71_18355 [Novosphingobium sp. PC22D]|uniref:TadE/TadG family type IV pilus assembly protein n=1 Tax=Novosphingobium sp. PC22D TaxID=1962403 RepID=UPI000BF1C931|nr:tight adherence protein TadE [Novosphingobium sp. PC22D]PEQ11247.1 hypothetical protein B2G71_18355 [Novosphingobium sp. PC22D]
MRIGRLLRALRRDTGGLAMLETALVIPFFLLAGLWGVELANYTVVTMRINQLAIHISDNASRIGESSVLENKKIFESDINDLLLGSSIQAGRRLPIYDRGRVIVSSLEAVPGTTTGEQYIHWQRCMGTKHQGSRYGRVGDVLPVGMGPSGQEVFADEGDAVIFVEIAYDYDPLVSNQFIGEDTIHAIASFTVRANRDLSRIYQRDPRRPDTVARCSRYTNDFADAA